MNIGAIGKVLQGPAGWALVLGVGGLVVWLLHDKLKKDLGDAAKGAAGFVSGDNVVTQHQTNYAGETVDAYQGKGVLGTLGGAANSASGGAFASFGEWISGTFFDPNAGYDPNADGYIAPVVLQSRKQAISDNYYDRGVLQ